MGLYRRLCAGLAICTLGFAHVAVAEDVGLTEGHFRVDESGAATYTLPIATPAGRAGVTPSIALSYSSNNSSDGPVGVGWSISGMSSISRCPPTPLHDGKIRAVQYNNEDKLCLDGRRLMLISGTYLAPNSVYRYEVDDFSTITARGGNSTNGPKYFEVHNKAGEIHYYGDSDTISFMFYDHDDAFVEPGGTAVGVKAKMWMLKVVKDAKSNFILYNYTKNTAEGSIYLNNIEYSGNMAVYKSPFAKIQLIYRDHDKGFKGYYAGAHTYHNKLLERIDTSIKDQNNADDIYRSYFLEYEESDFIEERILLTSVQECPDNDVNMSNCRKPTTFGWQRPALKGGGSQLVSETEPGMATYYYNAPYSTTYNPFPSFETLSSSAPNRYTTQVIDINGDGFQDIVYANGSYWYTKLGHANGVGSPISLSTRGVGKKDYALSIDYDGDGVRDLLVADSKTANWYAISYQPSSGNITYCPPGSPCGDFTYTSTKSVQNLGVIATGLEGEAQVMDINGDGNEDIVFKSGLDLKAHLNDGDGTFTANVVLHSFTSSPTIGNFEDDYVRQSGNMKTASQIDINGDGRSDLIMKVTETTGGCYYNGQIVPASGQAECRFDIGGTWSLSTTTKNHVYLATGILLAPSLTKLTEFNGAYDNIRVADFNGDGLSDIAYVYNNKWYYRLSNGKLLLTPREMGMTTAANRQGLNQFVDLNGDGRADVLHATSTTNWQVYFSRPTDTGEWISFHYRGARSFDNNAAIRFGDTNGDGKLDLLTSTGSSWKRYYNRENIKEFVINTFTTGFGVATTVDYKPMTNTNMYVMQASDDNINSDTFSPISGASLVNQVTTQIHNTSSVSVNYEYGGMLFHKKGRGSLGFQMLRTIDNQTGVKSETQYSQAYIGNDFAKAGMPIYSEQRRNGHLLSKATNTISVKEYTGRTPTQISQGDSGGLYPYISSSTELGYVFNSDETSNHISTTVTTNTIDTWGNPLEIAINVTQAGMSDYMNTTTTNVWGSATEQRYGRLKQTTVVKNRTGDANNKTRKSTFSYNSDKLLSGSIVSPNNAATKLTTAYTYDSYGNKTQTSVTGYSTAMGSSHTRTSKVVYGTRGRYIDYVENDLGERNTYKYNGLDASSANGVTSNVTQTSPNGIATITYYDDFQQVSSVNYPDNKTGTTVREFCNGCVTNSYFKITESLSGAPTKETFFDKWGRTVTTRIRGFDGTWLSTNVTYDSEGRQSRVYEPNSTYYTQTLYDALNRPEEIQNPNGSSVVIHYNGLETRTTDELGHNSYVYSNGFGETASTKDALLNTVTFTYDAFGNLTNTKTSNVNISFDSEITNVYDVWGRKTQMVDPVKGTWNYTYNAFGELYTQQTARNHTTTFNYDTLGRMTRRYEASEGTVCWIYGTTANLSQKAVGKLLLKGKFSGSANCSSLYVPTIGKYYQYDTLGRVKRVNTQIGYSSYPQLQTYDAYSRPLITTYPTGTQTVATKTHYNSNGYSYKTTREGDNYVLSEVLSMNSRGQVTEMKNGNVVTTDYGYDAQTGWLKTIDVENNSSLLHALDVNHDDRGNVTSRRSNYASSTGIGSDFTETYTYDVLNRLEERIISFTTGASSLPAAFDATYEYQYDIWGNLTFKTDVGYYKYDSTNVHELKSINSDSDFTGTVHNTFTTDDNGNVEGDGTRIFTYASFDKPTNITKGSASSSMLYGVDRELYYKHDTVIENGNTVQYKRYYIGAYEKLVRIGGNGNMTEHKYNIGNTVLTYRSGSNTTSFVHSDNQGSVIATTNASGQVMTQNIYDPFGKQGEVYRAPVYLTSLPPITDKGYTGHKQMNHVDIIHMGGRIYDPTIGRFLQADPFIQAPKNSQNYNRYSYVLNNPMSYTDPSGFNFLDNAFKKINKALGKFAPIVAIGLAIAGQGWAAQGIWQAATIGFASGGVATGSLKGAVVGSLTAAAFFSVGDAFSQANCKSCYIKNGAGKLTDTLTTSASIGKIASHASVGGISSVLSGGKFGHGFVSAGIAQAFAPAIDGISSDANFSAGRIVAASVVGGTTSALTGGKFANGAVTAAFARAFNDELHYKAAKPPELLEENVRPHKETYSSQETETMGVLEAGLEALSPPSNDLYSDKSYKRQIARDAMTVDIANKIGTVDVTTTIEYSYMEDKWEYTWNVYDSTGLYQRTIIQHQYHINWSSGKPLNFSKSYSNAKYFWE